MSDQHPEPIGPDVSWQRWVTWCAVEHGHREPTTEEIDFILWERTAFPMAGADHVKKQVHEYFAQLEQA